MKFKKVITSKAFDLEQVIYYHRQVGQAGKNGDAPKEARLNFGQQCIKSLYFKRLKKLNYRRLEGFFWEQKYRFLLSAFLWYTFIFNFKNKHKN